MKSTKGKELDYDNCEIVRFRGEEAYLHQRYEPTKRNRVYMTASPKTVRKGALAVEALHIFEEAAVDDLVVLDEQDRPVGLIDGQDMPRLKLV